MTPAQHAVLVAERERWHRFLAYEHAALAYGPRDKRARDFKRAWHAACEAVSDAFDRCTRHEQNSMPAYDPKAGDPPPLPRTEEP